METAGAKLQPLYSRDIAMSPEVVLQSLRGHFSADTGEIRMEFRGAHAQVSVAPEEARWWSPWLTIEIEPNDAQTRISGRFGSNPAFFTLWMMSLASALALTGGAVIFAVAQYFSNESCSALWAVAIGTAVSFALAGLPLLGQHYARHQLQLINDKLEECYRSITERSA